MVITPGIIWPWQNGQVFPHPCPDPVVVTSTPASIIAYVPIEVMMANILMRRCTAFFPTSQIYFPVRKLIANPNFIITKYREIVKAIRRRGAVSTHGVVPSGDKANEVVYLCHFT